MTTADRRTFLQTAGLTTAGLMTAMNGAPVPPHKLQRRHPGAWDTVPPVAQARHPI